MALESKQKLVVVVDGDYLSLRDRAFTEPRTAEPVDGRVVIMVYVPNFTATQRQLVDAMVELVDRLGRTEQEALDAR